ncbi:MAG: HAMP domain-containing protein [Planctomycetota bacterium]|nr:HAMP domain-containing protein [Planctomycetota bacterium]
MLRRKLLIRIGLLIACFVAGAAVAIYLLQDTISDIDRINADTTVLVDGVQTADECIAQIEDGRSRGADANANQIAGATLRLTRALAGVGEHRAVHMAGTTQAKDYRALVASLPAFLDATAASSPNAPAHAARVRADVRDLARSLRSYVATEQAEFGRYLRGLVMWLTLAALIMVNISVFVLLRTAQVVLKPVAELVHGSRELAAERFDHRVRVEQQDEFGELARAYNRLAEQLQANEERKAEALRQLAVTLNHDLNNAMATIEMQLSLLDRKSGRDANLANDFRNIQTTLARMGQTVASLKHIRRVVLTDYVDGQKMVDLARSVMPPPSSLPMSSGNGATGVASGMSSQKPSQMAS